MPLPPWDLVWPMLQTLLAPALGASLVVMLAVRLLGRERLAPLAAALAVVAGVAAADHFKHLVQWQPHKDRPVTVGELRTVLGWSLESRPSAVNAPNPPPAFAARHWLFWLAGLALLVELIAAVPGVPSGAAWAVRTLLAVLAGRLLTPVLFRNEMPPDPDLIHLTSLQSPATGWLLGIIILLEWATLLALAHKWKDGTAPGAMALCFAAAGVVLLLDACGSCSETALLFFAALAGPALIPFKWPSVTGPALAAAAVLLPGLLLTSLHDNAYHEAKVPVRCYLLVGLAPLAVAPLTLPFVARQPSWKTWLIGTLLVLIPAALGVFLAAQEVPLDFEALGHPE